MDMFNLPSYTKGKTFAEASKLIAKKFEGRTDKESVDTLQDLQGRLQQAQEYIKKQSQQTEQSQPQAPAMVDTNDHFLGGIMSQLGGAGEASAAGAAGAAGGAGAGGAGGPGVGGYMGAATEALELGKMAFGKPNVDTSGKTGHGAKTSQGGAALGGAMKGAQAGMAFGPWGAAIGGVVGGAAGLIGGKKAQDAEVEADAQHSYAMAKEYNNDYAGGGFMDNVDPNELVKMLQEGTKPPYMSSEQPYMSNDFVDSNKAKLDAITAESDAADAEMKFARDTNLTGVPTSNKPLEADSIDPYITQDDIKQSYDPSTLLRYAPAVTDAYQLATLKKPDEVSRGRLGNKYQSQQVDERSLVQGVQEGISNNRDAILSSSGGSGAAARANLLGLSLQGTKALSSAMQSAGEANRQDNRMAQQFNLGVDQTNLQQSNAEKLANEQNQGAYDTQKSQLISQLGSNLGEIGKEQLFKKYPELMGMDFDALGKYINGKNKKKKK